jgi:hypothetical protein
MPASSKRALSEDEEAELVSIIRSEHLSTNMHCPPTTITVIGDHSICVT